MFKFKYISSVLTLLVVASLIQCSSPSSEKQTQGSIPAIELNKPENGLYLVLEEFTDTTEGLQSKQFVVNYSHEFLDPDEEEPVLMLAIDTSDFVPLDLAEAPDSVQQADKRVNLMLTLTESAKLKLAEFTGKHVDQRVAIIIGGEAVTMHKVRMRIEGGKIQISRCTDNACEMLYLELKDSYQEQN